MHRSHLLPRFAALLALLFASLAQADPEIMVHEDDLSEQGELVSTVHANRTLRGQRRTDDGTWPAHHLSNLMLELATGLAPGWEAGIHLPAMRAGTDAPGVRAGQWGGSAVMFRLKHIRKDESGWFYGFNAEYDLNAHRYVADPRSIEFRGIVGLETEDWKLVSNPHLVWGFNGDATRHSPDFNVDFKVMRKFSDVQALGVELYTDWGQVRKLQPGAGDRTVYLVGEHDFGASSVHLGIGHGFKDTPERLIVKAVWSTSFR